MGLPRSDAPVASEQVLAELYSSAEISIKPHIVVALVLHKVVDPVRPCTLAPGALVPSLPGKGVMSVPRMTARIISADSFLSA